MDHQLKKREYLIHLGFEPYLPNVSNGHVYSKKLDYQKRNKKPLHTVTIYLNPKNDHVLITIQTCPEDLQNIFVGRIGTVSQLMYILSCTYINDLTK